LIIRNSLDVIGDDVGKSLIQWDSLEHGQAQELQHFIETCRELESPSDQAVTALPALNVRTAVTDYMQSNAANNEITSSMRSQFPDNRVAV
jgi:hypothetical protein